VAWRTTFRASVALLGTRRFGIFWFASLLSSLGTWAQNVGEPWLLVTIGASPFLIGLDSFAADGPAWLLTLAGGALADRGDRRRIIAVFQSIQMLCPASIVVLLIAGTIRPWMIIAFSAIVGITDALSMPSFQSIVPSIVSREQIGDGLALNSTQFSLSRILGPAIAGLLISSVGILACFMVNAASYVPFIGVALWILPRAAVRERADPAARSHLLSGIGEILGQPHLRGAFLTVFTTGLLCAPLVTFSPVLVKTVFLGGAKGFSTLLVAFGAGGLLGAAALLGTPAGVDRRALSSAFALAYGAIVVCVALDPWFWGLPILLLLAGASTTISNTSANTLVQSTARADLLGRTVSLYMLAVRGGASLGALVTGAVITMVGVQRALLFDGLAAIAVQALLAYWWRDS